MSDKRFRVDWKEVGYTAVVCGLVVAFIILVGSPS